jgi:uncharacterized protein (DUF1499 family)
MRWVSVAAVVVMGLPLALLLAGQAGLLAGTAPTDLGVRDGRLKAPSRTPNSVSSQADLWAGLARREEARIAPLELLGDGPATIGRLRAIVLSMPGAALVTDHPDYLYVRFRSRWLGFIDDTEFWFDPATQKVQVRSASRVGRSDLGVNRKRIEMIRARLPGA